MLNTSQISFHEATVLRIIKQDDTLQLVLGDVLMEGRKREVSFLVSSVSSLTIDGNILFNAPLMEAEDGEVLTLEMSDSYMYFIVEWHDFSRNTSIIRSYRVLGDKVTMSMS